MSDFIQQVSPDSLEAQFMALQDRVAELEQQILRMRNLADVTNSIGVQNADAITYPSFFADEDGIFFPQNGDGIQLTQDVRMSSEDVGTNLRASKVEVFDISRATRIESNGDFETGDLTGWTTAGSTTPTVSDGAHGGNYAAYLVGGATKGKISQRISLSGSDRAVFVKFRRKGNVAIQTKLEYFDASDVSLFSEPFYFSETESLNDQYALCTCGIRPTPTSGVIAKIELSIEINSTSGADYVFIDDVEIYESDATSKYSRVLITSGGMILYTGSFQIKDGQQQIVDLRKELLEFFKPAQFDGDVTAKTVIVSNVRTASETLADDTVLVITPDQSSGLISVGSIVANAHLENAFYRVTASNTMVGGNAGSLIQLGTGVLTNGTTTGVDGMLNVYAGADGNIYIKNRLGGNRAVFVQLT